MKLVAKKFLLLALLGYSTGKAHAQTITPDLQDTSKWTIINRTAEAVNDGGKKAIRLSEAPDEGVMILKGVEFSMASLNLM